MNKAGITVLGKDRPGIVCEVASLLSKNLCNIDGVTQTVLQDEFAGIFLVTLPREMSLQTLHERLNQGLLPRGLNTFVHELEEKSGPDILKQNSEPFVIISIGPDKIGLISAFSCIMKKWKVNITHLKFVNRSSMFADNSVTIYEVDVPKKVNISRFTRALEDRAKEEGVEVSVQHKRIFEEICRL